MKIIKYKADLKRMKLSDHDTSLIEKDGQKSMFENMLTRGLSSAVGNIGGAQARSLGRILEALDRTQDEFIIVEEYEFELLKLAFCSESAKFEPAQIRLTSQYAEAIAKAETLNAEEDEDEE